MNGKPKTILILTADAGLGHRSAAEAIRDALQLKYGERVEPVIRNPLDHPDIPEIVRESQSDYDEVVNAIPELYKLGYEISDSNFPVSVMEEAFSFLLLEVMQEIIAGTSPDLIISTYPIYGAPLADLKNGGRLQIPFVIVTTDLVTVHHVWFNDGATLLTVPTEAVRQRALDAGLNEAQVIKTGIPVDPRILSLKDREKTDLREELGWQKEPASVLVVGSPRIPSLVEMVEALDSCDEDIQFALVAGGDETLRQSFEENVWHHPAKVYGFVENMPELMRASDVIVCKAGGLIVTESLASGLPMMLVHVLPGQERGNAGYIVDHNAGRLCEEPGTARETLIEWLENDQAELRAIAENASKLGHPDAALTIADEAWRLLNE